MINNSREGIYWHAFDNSHNYVNISHKQNPYDSLHHFITDTSQVNMQCIYVVLFVQIDFWHIVMLAYEIKRLK